MKVIAQAPSRISLFGGGSDTEPYASTYGGICLNFAINIRHKIVLGGKEKLNKGDSSDFIKAFTALPVWHGYDNSIESGLGSSAALAVALVGAEARFFTPVMSLSDVAERAWDIEVNKIGLFGGKQDQYVSAYGGVNVMEFTKDKVIVTPLAKDFIAPLLPYMLLFDTGLRRKSAKIQEGLKVLTNEQVVNLTLLKNMVAQAIEPIAKGEITTVARLLNAAWDLKKRSNVGVTNEEIDKIYEQGIAAGALAGKLLGSGGGGHILFLVAPENRQDFIKKIEGASLKWVDFSIDWNGLETRIIK